MHAAGQGGVGITTAAGIVFLAGWLGFAGCSPPRPYRIVRCSGRATFHGKPITDMTITMSQSDRGRPSRSPLGADGSFMMRYTFRDQGVQTGENQVNFLWEEMAQPPAHVQAVLDYMSKHAPLRIMIDTHTDGLAIEIP